MTPATDGSPRYSSLRLVYTQQVPNGTETGWILSPADASSKAPGDQCPGLSSGEGSCIVSPWLLGVCSSWPTARALGASLPVSVIPCTASPSANVATPASDRPPPRLGRGKGRWTKRHGWERGPEGGREGRPHVSPRPSWAPTPALQEGRAAQCSCCFRHLPQRGLLWLREGPGWDPTPVPAVRACCPGAVQLQPHRRSHPSGRPGVPRVHRAVPASTSSSPDTPRLVFFTCSLARGPPRTLSGLGLFLKTLLSGRREGVFLPRKVKLRGRRPVPCGLGPQLHCPVEGAGPTPSQALALRQTHVVPVLPKMSSQEA